MFLDMQEEFSGLRLAICWTYFQRDRKWVSHQKIELNTWTSRGPFHLILSPSCAEMGFPPLVVLPNSTLVRESMGGEHMHVDCLRIILTHCPRRHAASVLIACFACFAHL